MDLLFICADGGGRGVKKLVSFCGRQKWMTPTQNFARETKPLLNPEEVLTLLSIEY